MLVAISQGRCHNLQPRKMPQYSDVHILWHWAHLRKFWGSFSHPHYRDYPTHRFWWNRAIEGETRMGPPKWLSTSDNTIQEGHNVWVGICFRASEYLLREDHGPPHQYQIWGNEEQIKWWEVSKANKNSKYNKIYWVSASKHLEEDAITANCDNSLASLQKVV